ncbi:hypothetical protein DMC25_09145 [Caulobacter sp. D4A]|nr:hypothetical protein DMC25_09145 [Caulobacter sp. D4A]
MEVGIKTDKRSLATLMVTDCGADRVTIVIFIVGALFLLPLREKVAAESRRMRGLSNMRGLTQPDRYRRL